MPHELDVPVLIVGGGPVGLTAALDLAWRDIEVVIVERRGAGDPPKVKSNHVSSRSMEIFRRLGLADHIRNIGLPPDYPNDVAYRTTLTGFELGRIRIPSPTERRAGNADFADDTRWPTPEPPHRINQIYLEPLLFETAAAHPRIRICTGVEVDAVAQNEVGVFAQAHELVSGDRFAITSHYLIGADGAQSTVRRQLGIKLEGTAELLRNLSSYIRAPTLRERLPGDPFWMAEVMNERRAGAVISIDGADHWLLHVRMPAGVTDFESIDRDQAIREVLGVGPNFDYELISKEDWVARRLVATRLAEGRIFLAGDAAHLWIPNAGYGMNAGIADVTNLTWMLAAVLQGWASPLILNAYQEERHPITEQVSRFIAAFGAGLHRRRLSVPDQLEAASSEGEQIRARFGNELVEMNIAQYYCGGLNFGYFYDQSSIIAYDGASAPAYNMRDFTLSTVPGCRTPHVWLEDGRSLFDELGPYYTLIDTTAGLDCGAFLAEARRRGIPVKLVRLTAEECGGLYDYALVLVRADQHIAWRGNAPPDAGLLDIITGYRAASQSYHTASNIAQAHQSTASLSPLPIK